MYQSITFNDVYKECQLDPRFKQYTRDQLKEAYLMNQKDYDYSERGWAYAIKYPDNLDPIYEYCQQEYN